MTALELETELAYRWNERAAILTDGSPRPLTPTEIRLCDEDMEEYRAKIKVDPA